MDSRLLKRETPTVGTSCLVQLAMIWNECRDHHPVVHLIRSNMPGYIYRRVCMPPTLLICSWWTLRRSLGFPMFTDFEFLIPVNSKASDWPHRPRIRNNIRHACHHSVLWACHLHDYQNHSWWHHVWQKPNIRMHRSHWPKLWIENTKGRWRPQAWKMCTWHVHMKCVQYVKSGTWKTSE